MHHVLEYYITHTDPEYKNIQAYVCHPFQGLPLVTLSTSAAYIMLFVIMT